MYDTVVSLFSVKSNSLQVNSNKQTIQQNCLFNEKEMIETCFTSEILTILILFLSTESLIDTYIHVEKSEVLQGSDAEFICSTSSPLNKTQSKNMILAYLIKDEKPIKVNIWDTEKMKTTFTLRDVRMEDAGTYSCAVLSNILPYHERRFKQNNKVHFQIAGKTNKTI